MYPLLDNTTMNRRAAEGRRAAAAARTAKGVAGRTEEKDGRHRHAVRHALGATLVRAGLRLIQA